MTPEIVATPVEGWRAWRLRIPRAGEKPWLLPLYKDGIFFPAQPASCVTPMSKHVQQTPTWDCNCGYWLLKDAPPQWWHPRHRNEVFGTTTGWGRIIEHEDGWRCEYIKPQSLIIHPAWEHLIDPLAQLYDCEFQVSEHPSAYEDKIKEAFLATARATGDFTKAMEKLTVTVNNTDISVFVTSFDIDIDRSGLQTYRLEWEEL